MTTLKFVDTHNMVAFLSKPTESDGFEQIVDFLNAHPIRHALTINPTIYISCIEQFWSTVMVKTINGEVQLHALVDGKKIIITEASVRRDLQLANEEGVEGLPNSTIFEQLTLMGPKTTTWNEFSSTMASVIIYEVVHKELGDSLVRAATNASSLEAEQDSACKEFAPLDNSKATIIFMIHCSQEKTKTAQHNEIASLKRRVKKLKKKNRSRTHKLKRLYKVGLTARVESSDNEESLGEDASKQGRINDIDADDEITLIYTVHTSQNPTILKFQHDLFPFRLNFVYYPSLLLLIVLDDSTFNPSMNQDDQVIGDEDASNEEFQTNKRKQTIGDEQPNVERTKKAKAWSEFEKVEKNGSSEPKLAPAIVNGKYDHIRMQESIAHWILMHEHSFSIVEEARFDFMMKVGIPQWPGLSRTTAKNDCVRVYQNQKKKLKDMLKKVDSISLTTDMWKSKFRRFGYM
ncbi:hypothetical protein Tco_0667548 [Tanacetum coccineum]